MKWHDFKDKPSQSCECVCIMSSNYVATMPYSKKHNAFNARDCFADKKNSINDGIVAWCYYDEFIEEVKNGIKGLA